MAIVNAGGQPTNPTNRPPQGDPPPEIPRDRWGRPKIAPVGGGTLRPYTRASTLGGTLEDQYGLGQWRMRQVAWGLGRRQDLVLAATACSSEDKGALGDIVERAMEAAESSAAATIGTSLHAITEQMDQGKPMPAVGPVHEPMLVAYAELMAHFTIHGIEQFVVCDDIETAGTFDRLLSPRGQLVAPDGEVFGPEDRLIGDLKTSSTSDYFGIKFACQLGVYAHGRPYVHEAGRLPWPDDRAPSTTWGLIVHAPSGGATADLYWVDLGLGWELALLAGTVRDWRKRKDLVVPAELPAHAEPGPALGIRIRNAPSRVAVEALYDAHVAVWTDEHTDLARARLAELESADR